MSIFRASLAQTQPTGRNARELDSSRTTTQPDHQAIDLNSDVFEATPQPKIPWEKRRRAEPFYDGTLCPQINGQGMSRRIRNFQAAMVQAGLLDPNLVPKAYSESGAYGTIMINTVREAQKRLGAEQTGFADKDFQSVVHGMALQAEEEGRWRPRG